MRFLEATRVLERVTGGVRMDVVLAASGTLDPLLLFLRAEWALRGYELVPTVLPFNTLQQHLLTNQSSAHAEILLLLPWDFAAELDWRTGVPGRLPESDAIFRRANEVANLIQRRVNAKVAYLPAPLPPILGSCDQMRALAGELNTHASSLRALMLSESDFSMAAFLASGSPFSGSTLGDIARRLCDFAFENVRPPAKVVVTDLDNVLWSGVLADEGPDGVHFGPDAEGYRHYVYQTLLARLKNDGVLLAAVTRNAPEIVDPIFAKGQMVLTREDFVAVLASYNAKSAQIRGLAKELDLALDAFLFVDDNPIELAEVSDQLPAVRTIRFPESDADLAAFLNGVAGHFPRHEVATAEDRARTEMYRRRLAGMAPSDLGGADLTDFLRQLQMRLTIRDCSTGDRQRAIQLINKTNQFNLNGRRMTDAEVQQSIDGGCVLLTARLDDRTGSHGEILACLIEPSGEIQSLVMSCRVFQRRVEYAFMCWLADNGIRPKALRFASTEKNEPLRRFLSEPVFSAPDARGLVAVDIESFAATHGSVLSLFELASEGN